MAESSVIGLLRVLLTADTAQFTPALRTAATDVQNFGKTVTQTGQQVSGFQANVGKTSSLLGKMVPALTATAVIGLAKSFTNAASEIHDLSERTGISIREIQRLKFAADQTGTSLDAVATAASQLQKRIAGDDKAAAGAIKRLGLELDAIRGMDPGQMFETIAAAVQNVQDPAERTRIAFELFGRSGTQLLPMMTQGVKELGDEAERLGIVMSDDVVKSGDEMGDNFDKLIGVGKSLIGTVLSPLLPLLNLVASGFTAIIGPVNGLLQKFFAFLNPVEQFRLAMTRAREELENWGVVASKVPQIAGDATKGVEAWRKAVADRAAVPLEDALANEDAIIAQLSGTLRTNNAAWDAQAKASDAAREALGRAADELQALHEALASKGIVTTEGYTSALADLVEQLNIAAKDGAPALRQALDVLGPEIATLGTNATESGQDLERLIATIDAFRVAAGLTPIKQIAADTIAWEQANIRAADSIGDIAKALPKVDAAAEVAAVEAGALADAYQRFGITTRDELSKTARQAEADYARIAAAVGKNAPEAIEAFRKMVEAQRAESGKIPSFWESDIVPRVRAAAEHIRQGVAGTFADMLTGAQGFKDGFLNIWDSIRQAISNILASILDQFINSFLKGLIGAMLGQKGAFQSAFAGMFGGGGGVPGMGGLLGKIPGLGGLLGGGVALAGAPGTVTAGLPTLAGVGTTVPVGGVPGAAGGIGALGAGALAGGAGFGLGVLGQNLFGRGVGGAAFGAGTGAGAGLAIGAALAPATMGLSLAIGAVAGLLGSLVKFGPSKEELAARQITGGFKEQTFAGLSTTQRQEAMGAGWTDPKAAGTLIAVRDAYLAIGKSAQEAEQDVAAMWAAEVKGPEATQAAMQPILAALEEYRKKTGDAAAADAAHTEQIKVKAAALQQQIQTIQGSIKTLDDELAHLDASEAPEKHMGTIEKRARERIAKERDRLQAELQKATEAATKAAQEMADATTNAAKESELQVANSLTRTKDGFLILGDVAEAEAQRARDALASIGKGLPPIAIKYKFEQTGKGPDLGPYARDWSYRLMGHAAGGVFDRPHLAMIAEGGESEIVGSISFMTRALEGAVSRVGGGGGTPRVVIVPAFISGDPSASDVERLVQTIVKAEPAIAGNLGGVRTALRSAAGIR